VRRFTKRGIDPHRHLVATILTGGLWGLPWWILHRHDAERPWRCCICCSVQDPKAEPPEARALRGQRKSGAGISIAPGVSSSRETVQRKEWQRGN